MSVLLISTGFAALLYLLSGICIVTAMKKGADAKASSLLRFSASFFMDTPFREKCFSPKPCISDSATPSP